MAAQEAKNLNVYYEMDMNGAIPYKNRIQSQFHSRDPRFWNEGDLVHDTGKIQLRAGVNDIKNQVVIYMKKDFTGDNQNGDIKASILELEKKELHAFTTWFAEKAEEMQNVEYPQMMDSLKELGLNAYLKKTVTGYPFTFFDGGYVKKFGEFRARLAFCPARGANFLYLNVPGNNVKFSSWPGPTIEVSCGEAARILGVLRHFDTIF